MQGQLTRLSAANRLGFSLLELLATLAIVAIVLAGGVPMVLQLFASTRLQGVAQDTYALLQYARSDALRAMDDRYVVWQQDQDAWCAVVARRNDCNCLREYCGINHVVQQIQSSDYPNVSVKPIFSAGQFTRFDGLRGLANGHAGSVRYQLRDAAQGQAEVRVVVSRLGRLRYCSWFGDIGGYPPC